MKSQLFFKSVVPAVLVMGIFGFSCGSSGNDQRILDSIARADSMLADQAHPDHCDWTRWIDSCEGYCVQKFNREMYSLDSLLYIPDEAALISKFGKDQVKYDTISGAEGYYTMGTILKTEPQTHIEFIWADERNKKNVVSVTLVSDQDWYSDTLQAGTWRTLWGVTIGMPIRTLECANGRPFTFYGFGWDYAGSVIDWQKGNLEGKGIAVQLSEGPIAPSVNLSEAERNSVLGDVEVQSDNPALKYYQPKVWSISVAKVQ